MFLAPRCCSSILEQDDKTPAARETMSTAINNNNSSSSGRQPREIVDESRAMWSDGHSDEEKRENGSNPRGHSLGPNNEAGAGESLGQGQQEDSGMRLSHAHHHQEQGGHGNHPHGLNGQGHQDVPEGARMKRNKPVKWSAEEDRRLREAVAKVRSSKFVYYFSIFAVCMYSIY